MKYRSSFTLVFRARFFRLLGCVAALAVATAGGPASGGELDGRRLSLREAVELALEQNLALSIERVNPQIAEKKITEASGAFDPVISLSTSLSRLERPVNSALEQIAEDGVLLQQSFIPEASIGGKLYTGTRYSLSLASALLLTNNPQRLYDRSFQPVLSFGLAQPLLRDFGTGPNLARVRQAGMNEEKSRFALQGGMLKVVLQVETAYGVLFFGQENVKVVTGSLALAEDLVKQVIRMKEAGLATALDVLEAKSAVQARRAALARARADVLKAQAELHFLVDPKLAITGQLLATESPMDKGPPRDLQEKVDRGTARRPEISEQQSLIESLRFEDLLAENKTRWQLDLVGNVSFTGLSGRREGPFIQSLPARLEGRDTFGEAFNDYFTRKSMTWSVGLQLKLPLWNREASARLDEARLRLRQEELRLSLIRKQIAVEVEGAFWDLTAEHARLVAAREAAALAREKLAVAERDLAAGRTTVRKVLEAQNHLAVAEGRDIEALVLYGSARSRLEAAQGLSLDTYGVGVRR
jgi:outer membrane protein TolC